MGGTRPAPIAGRGRHLRRIGLATLALLGAGCSIRDGRTARKAQTDLLGLSALELQSCLGAPDQRSIISDTQILSYYATSTGGGECLAHPEPRAAAPPRLGWVGNTSDVTSPVR